ncbi:hypothetical protein [Flavobacterium sp. FlaQc-50]|jgi:hypothetical protein|uniref:hypothetical protein n=1 Tax=unclassified Flavobacterium TaxID=196869 RepID=UPI003757CC0A
MKNYNLDFLLNKKINSIHAISINENDTVYVLSDTLVLTLDDDSLVQIVMDYDIKVYPLSSLEKVILLGDYDLQNSQISLVEISKINDNQKITAIYNYSQSTYHFGSKFLNANHEFLFGFCFGWDEIMLVNEETFHTMLNSYEEKTETIVLEN